jgi:hypothetical protein
MWICRKGRLCRQKSRRRERVGGGTFWQWKEDLDIGFPYHKNHKRIIQTTGYHPGVARSGAALPDARRLAQQCSAQICAPRLRPGGPSSRTRRHSELIPHHSAGGPDTCDSESYPEGAHMPGGRQQPESNTERVGRQYCPVPDVVCERGQVVHCV